MTISQKDFEALKKFKPTLDAFQAVNAWVDSQESFASLKNATKEVEVRLEDLRAQEGLINGRLTACAEAEKSTKRTLKEAGDKADAVIDEARLEADKIKQDAQKTGEDILDRAKEGTRVLREQSRKDLNEIETLTEGKRTQFTELADAVDAKRKELDDLNGQLAAAKEHIAKLLKG